MRSDNLESLGAGIQSKAFLLFYRRKSNSRKESTGKPQPQLLIEDQYSLLPAIFSKGSTS